MITRIEAQRFRCLKSNHQPLGPFQILVGPNGSGKSASLDVLLFLSDLIAKGLDKAVSERTQNFHDLVWGRQGNSFQLSVEAEVPAERGRGIRWIRYEVEVRIDPETDAVFLAREDVLVS